MSEKRRRGTSRGFRTQISANGFLDGAKVCAPVALGAIPFGAAAGLSAISVDMPVHEALLMSVVVFAGAAQLASLDLAASGAPAVVIVLIALVINLRFAMYSAALSEWTRPKSLLGRAGLAYILSDQAFALTSLDRQTRDDDERPQNRSRDFYLGAALTLWLAWQIGTAVGVFLGRVLPEDAGLSFVAPLAFLALGVGAIKSRADLVAAASGVVAYLLMSGLPYGLALLPATIIGLTVGFFVAKTRKPKEGEVSS